MQWLRNSIEDFNIGLNQTEEEVNELEDSPSEIIQSEEQNEKRKKMDKESQCELWDIIEKGYLRIVGVLEEKRRKGKKTCLKK